MLGSPEGPQSIEITVEPHAGIRRRCSRCQKPAPGYDCLPQRRWLFVPLWGIATYCRDDVRHGRKHSTCPRDDWFQDAYEKTAGCDLVFLDPDNGIECAKLLPAQAKSRKYVC